MAGRAEAAQGNFSEALEALQSANDVMSAGLDARILACEASLAKLREEPKSAQAREQKQTANFLTSMLGRAEQLEKPNRRRNTKHGIGLGKGGFWPALRERITAMDLDSDVSTQRSSEEEDHDSEEEGPDDLTGFEDHDTSREPAPSSPVG